MSTKTDHRPDDSPPAYGSAARTEEEAEQMVQSYASEHCAENTGHCRGCGHRQSAAFFGRPDEDDWCYLAEGNLRESSVEMCPALSPQNDNKLSDRSPETPVESTAAQGEGADSARAKAEAESVTEPVGLEPRAETERQGCGSLQRMVRRGCGIGDLRRRLPSSGELAECR